jgi:hypothetical protein
MGCCGRILGSPSDGDRGLRFHEGKLGALRTGSIRWAPVGYPSSVGVEQQPDMCQKGDRDALGKKLRLPPSRPGKHEQAEGDCRQEASEKDRPGAIRHRVSDRP